MLSMILSLAVQAALYGAIEETPDVGLGNLYSIAYGHPGESLKARKGWGDKLNYSPNGVAGRIALVPKGRL